MSIINDALKKAQHSLTQTSQRAKPTMAQPTPFQTLDPVFPQQPETARKDNFLWSVTILVGLALLGCVTSIIFLISITRQSQLASVKTNVGSSLPTNSQQIARTIATASPVPEKDKGNTMTLNGIITSPDEQMALINNQILKAGDYIDDKRILSISADQVKIFDSGKVLILTTKP